jgi:multiple sugar transport system substrate-binding protein
VALKKYSRNNSAATKFLNYLSTPEAITEYDKAGGIPAMPSVLKANTSINPAFDKIAESIDKYGYSVPVFPSTFEAYSKLAEDLSGAWVGQQDPKAALQQANTDLQKLLG